MLIRSLKCFIEFYYKTKRNPDAKHFFLFDVPEHGNLGDHAIVIAEKKFLKDYFDNIMIHEIPKKMNNICIKLLKPLIKDNIILITGGGNMGTLWFHHETSFREIINNYLNNKIIFFPQTIYYEESKWGQEELKKSKEIYKKHNDLFLSAREEKSYNIMIENFQDQNNNVIFAPDIVLYLNKTNNNIEREGILLCLRNDKESILPNKYKKQILEVSNLYRDKVTYTDTHIGVTVKEDCRNELFEKKLDEFRKAELVITDRLHGMIFATITSTPCIAFNNKSDKVKGVYEYINYNEYLFLIDENINDLYNKVNELLEENHSEYDNEKLKTKFVDLKTIFN